LAIVGGVPAQPSHGGAFVAERVVLADQQDEAQGIGAVDVAQLCSSGGVRGARSRLSAWDALVTTTAIARPTVGVWAY